MWIVANTSLTTLDIFNLIASICSIVLAILAIILAVVFYFASKNAEVKTKLALGKIEQATGTINSVSMKLLNKLASYVTAPNPTEQSLLEMVSKLNNANTLNNAKEPPNNPTKDQLDQLRVDNLIAAMFYAVVSNTSLQGYLPADIGQLEATNTIAQLIDRSKLDYFTLKGWILASGNKLNSSPVKFMFDEALTAESELKNTTEVYASRQSG